MALPRIRGELAAAPMRILTGGNGPKGGVRKRIDAAPITPRGLVREFGLCPVADIHQLSGLSAFFAGYQGVQDKLIEPHIIRWLSPRSEHLHQNGISDQLGGLEHGHARLFAR